MEWLFSAAVMGLAGSLHCMGMCGPLVVALEMTSGKSLWMRSRWIYHAGRIASYALMGAAFGWIGSCASAFGFQRWLVLFSGVLMLILIGFPIIGIRWKFFTMSAKVRTAFMQRMRNNASGARFVLGMLNGILPCGLVYVALAASLSAGSWWHSMLFMMVFGIMTSPALFFISLLTRWLSSRIRSQSMRWVQFGLIAMAFLIILRGANLGIPFISPMVDAAQPSSCCHQH